MKPGCVLQRPVKHGSTDLRCIRMLQPVADLHGLLAVYANMQLVRHPRFTRLLTHLQIPATAAAAPLCARQSNLSSHHYPPLPNLSVGINASAQRTAATAAGYAHTSAATATATAMPVVYHPLYSAPQLASGHRFPMQVFCRIHERLLQQRIITEAHVSFCISSRCC